MSKLVSFFNILGEKIEVCDRYSRTHIGNMRMSIDNMRMFNVRDYGAKGDGVNDDTESIKKAITDCGNKGFVYIPNGNYLITSTITLPRHIVIKGQNHINTKLIPNSDISVFKTEESYYTGLTVSDLAISDVKGVTNNSSAIYFPCTSIGITGGSFKNIRIENYAKGFSSPQSAPNGVGVTGVTFENITLETKVCAFEMYHTTALKLMYVTSDHVNLQNSGEWDFIFDGNTQSGGGIYLLNVVSQAPHKGGMLFKDFLQIFSYHLSCDNTGATGIKFNNCQQVHCTGGYFAIASRIYGGQAIISIENNCNNFTFTDCSFIANQSTGSFAGVNANELINSKFIGCVFTENKGKGIFLFGGRQNKITGCQFNQNEGDAITLQGSTYNIISENTINNNSGHGISDNGGGYNIITSNSLSYNTLGNLDIGSTNNVTDNNII